MRKSCSREMIQTQCTCADVDVRRTHISISARALDMNHFSQDLRIYEPIIHTLQLNFLFSDWLFSKYAECIKNVHCSLYLEFCDCTLLQVARP